MRKISVSIIYINLTSLLGLFNPANAILSATTMGLINGNAPILQNTSMDDVDFKLYLELDSDNSFELKPHTDNKYYIGANTKFSQIKSKFDVNLLKSHFSDPDGDEIESVEVISESYLWKKNGSAISDTGDLVINNNACDSTTNYTYTVTAISNIKAKTKYGLPHESEIITVQHDYNIDANTSICYLKPTDMSINNGKGSSLVEIDPSYDEKFFDPNNGFKYDSGFPTMAFEKAAFRIMLSDDSSKKSSQYKFNILNSNNEISINDNNQVIFNSRPKNKVYYVQITKSANNFLTFYPIKLEPKNSWFTNGGSERWSFGGWKETSNPELFCEDQGKKVPRLRDLGNSEYAMPPYIPNEVMPTSKWKIYGNGYFRTISSPSKREEGKGGLQAEWGQLTGYSAGFKKGWYWSSDSRNDSPKDNLVRFVSGAVQGNFSFAYKGGQYAGIAFYAICMEDLLN